MPKAVCLSRKYHINTVLYKDRSDLSLEGMNAFGNLKSW